MRLKRCPACDPELPDKIRSTCRESRYGVLGLPHCFFCATLCAHAVAEYACAGACLLVLECDCGARYEVKAVGTGEWAMRKVA